MAELARHQRAGSLLVALAIAAVAVAIVTAHFGPTSHAELEAREGRIEMREEAREWAKGAIPSAPPGLR